MGSVSEVRGMSAALQQAEAGMKLFEALKGSAAECDVPAAEQYRAEVERRIAELEEEAAKLTGKDNKKERTAKGKEIADLKVEPRYIDACKVAKGLEPQFGNFMITPSVLPEVAAEQMPAPAPTGEAVAKKKEREVKAKKEEAGLSPAEARELEKLKQEIMERKTALKEQGLSGGQQNKDPEVVSMVARMQEFKEKQEPGSTKKEAKKEAKKSRAPLTAEEQKEMSKLQGEVEAYKHRLKEEFGYSQKDMKNDPDLAGMETRLREFEKRQS